MLIELVARVTHQIAVWLYNQDTNRHKDDALGSFRPSDDEWGYCYPKTSSTTLFCHPWYRDYDQYPDGVADCVGYWAEARIMGGVVLFDQCDPASVADAEVSGTPGSPGTEEEGSRADLTVTQREAIYIHADRRDVTYRICQLTDGQKQALLQFLLSDGTPPPWA